MSFFVLPQSWLEITKGRDLKRAAILCLEAGYLLIGQDNKRLQVRLLGMGKGMRVYVLGEWLHDKPSNGAA